MNDKTLPIKEDQYPQVEDIAAYVDSIKTYFLDNTIADKEINRLVKNLPSPQTIKKNLSNEEIKILFHTVGYIWKKITGNNIISDTKIEKKPDTLCGNYWMLQKGVLLYGVNHYTIIKQNLDLFRSLLGINAFALHEKMGSEPNSLIKLVLDHGGMRIFVSKDKRSYFQLSDETYGKWGSKKIRKYDFYKMIVKIIDRSAPYNGWESGITILL